MNKQSHTKHLFLIGMISLSCAWSAAAQTIAMHATTERSGAQGNELTLVAQHNGNLTFNADVFFYVQRPNGQIVNLGRVGTPIGNLWYKNWIAEAPGTYQVFAVLRDGSFENSPQIAAAAPVAVTITGSALAMHATAERNGAQGNELTFVAQHSGNLPFNAEAFFYVQRPNGQVVNLGRVSTPTEGNFWYKNWIAEAPGTYQVFAVLRNGSFESSPQIAAAAPIAVTITGSALAMHATAQRNGAQGNELTFVAQHSGNLPFNAEAFFYVQRPNGQVVNLGRVSTPTEGNFWYKNWTAEAPGTYQVFAVLRNGSFESSPQIAAAAPIAVTITGSALAMHSSSTRVFAAGQKARAVAVTSGRLPAGASIFFYAQDTVTQGLIELGRQGTPVEQLWSLEWIPPVTSSFNVYAVMRDGSFENSPEIARTGNLLVVPAGTPIPLPFETVAGTYRALLSGPAQPMLTVQLTAGGGVTGRLMLDGLVYRFKNQLGSDGTVSIRSDLRGQPSLNLVLRSDGTSGFLAGNYRLGGGSPVEFSLLAPAYTGKGSSVSPLAKKTANVLLVPEPEAGDSFLGHGYFRATFDRKGGARIAGRMPDGRTVAGYLDALDAGLPGETVLPAYVVWKGRSLATLKGELRVQESAEQPLPLLEGTLDWEVPADAKRRILPQAFRATFAAVGNVWTPAAGTNALTSETGAVNFLLQTDPEGRVLGAASNVSGTWGNDNVPVFASPGLPAGAKWGFSPKTGVFSGTLPGAEGAFRFSGLLVPASGLEAGGRELRGAGFVIGKAASAPMEITTE